MKQTLFYFLFASLFLFTSCTDDDICVIDETLTIENTSINELSADNWEAYTDIVINASAEEVWSVLTDFDNMPNWSSLLQGMVGDISNGGMVTVTILFADQMTGEINSSDFTRTLIYEEGVLFGWSESFELVAGSGITVLDNHQFKVEAISECQARFIQTDDFTGTIPDAAGITLEQLAALIATSYEQFNQELKAEVEK